MEYRRLGQSGLKVSEICLGTMAFGSRADETESLRIVDLALEGGEKSQRNNSIEPRRYPPVMLVDLLDNSNEEIIQLLNSLHESTAEKNQYLCFISKHCPLPDRYNLLSVNG